MSPHVAVTLAFLCGALSTLGATFLVWGGALHYLRHALVCSWCGHQFEDWDLGSITVTIAGGPADGPPISAPRAVQCVLQPLRNANGSVAGGPEVRDTAASASPNAD